MAVGPMDAASERPQADAKAQDKGRQEPRAVMHPADRRDEYHRADGPGEAKQLIQRATVYAIRAARQGTARTAARDYHASGKDERNEGDQPVAGIEQDCTRASREPDAEPHRDAGKCLILVTHAVANPIADDCPHCGQTLGYHDDCPAAQQEQPAYQRTEDDAPTHT